MKCLYTLAATLLAGTSLFSQSLSIPNPVSVVNGTSAALGATGELAADWTVTNISTGTLSVRARREVQTAVTGSTNYFCWGVCYQESTDVSPVSQAQTMDGGTSNTSFYAHYRPHGLAGQTIIKYCFFDNNNPTDETCQVVNFCVDGCTINVQELGTLRPVLSAVGPNPVIGMSTISYDTHGTSQSARLVFYDALGQVVRTEQLTGSKGMVILNAAEFANGIYLYALESNGVMSEPQRMLVAH
jgi:Secretion system C-terminal sorting domain